LNKAYVKKVISNKTMLGVDEWLLEFGSEVVVYWAYWGGERRFY